MRPDLPCGITARNGRALTHQTVCLAAYYPVWALPLEDGSPAAVANTKVTDVTMKFYPRLILAKDEAEYETIWADFLKEFNAIDLDSLQTEIDRQIAEKMAK